MNVIDVQVKGSMFSPPSMVVESSMSHMMDKVIGKESSLPYSTPTSHYALLSQDGCQTTWHQDFSATSVFYTVLTGEKIFFIVKPTVKNQKLFDRWDDSETDIRYFFYSNCKIVRCLTVSSYWHGIIIIVLVLRSLDQSWVWKEVACGYISRREIVWLCPRDTCIWS